MNENDNNEKLQGKDLALLRHWKSWGSWYSWGSPVGIGLGWFLFMVGTGILLFLMGRADQAGSLLQ